MIKMDLKASAKIREQLYNPWSRRKFLRYNKCATERQVELSNQVAING